MLYFILKTEALLIVPVTYFIQLWVFVKCHIQYKFFNVVPTTTHQASLEQARADRAPEWQSKEGAYPLFA